jgi:hypothetical protein
MVVQRDVRMNQTAASRIQKLTDEAMAKIATKHTVALQDGATRQITETGYVTAEDGDFQVYIVPARRRTRRMGEHYRATFYTMESGTWKRCSKDALVAKMDAEA